MKISILEEQNAQLEVVIWAAVICISMSRLPVMTKNILTFCAATPLMLAVENRKHGRTKLNALK